MSAMPTSNSISTRNLVICAMIAALYTALCLALAPIGYGVVQFRVAEALTLLPVLSPLAVWGVTLGCAISNFVGFLWGVNIIGFVDVIFGTAATLIAAIISYRLRGVRVYGIPVLSAIPPVIVNALVIGLELTMIEATGFNIGIFMFNALSVGMGQMVSCFALGLPLIYFLEKTGVSRLCFGGAAR